MHREDLLYVGSGSINDLLNAGIKQLEPTLVSNLNEAFGESRVTELLETLKKLLSHNYPIATDLAIISERWLSRVQPSKSWRKSTIGSKTNKGEAVTSEMTRKRICDLCKQLEETDKQSLITTFLDCNPAAAPHRELL